MTQTNDYSATVAKGSISNWQQLSKDEVKAVSTWLRKRPNSPNSPTPYLFISRKGKAISRSQFFRIVQAVGKKAGLPLFLPHAFFLKGLDLRKALIPK
jgi:integrase